MVFVLQPLCVVASVKKLVKQMRIAGHKKAQKVVEQSKAEAAVLLDNLVEDEHFLREDVKKQDAALTTKALKKTEEILSDAHEQALDFARNAYEHVERLKQRTAEAVDVLIQQAEREAFKIKAERRKKIMREFLHESALREKDAWKNGLREEFLANLVVLEGIVKDGEATEEIPHFIETFRKQRSWFLATLDKVKRPSDQQYFLLYQKSRVLNNIVQAYKKVSVQLINLINQHGIKTTDMAKPKLLVLYDVQAMIMRKKESADHASATFLTERECGILAESLCNKLFAKEQKETLIVAVAAKDALLEASDDLARREQAGLREAVIKAQHLSMQQVSNMTDEIAKKAEEGTLHKITPILESLNKDKAALEFVVLEQKDTIDRIQKELQERENSIVKKTAEKSIVPVIVKVPESNEQKAVEQERINRASFEAELLAKQRAAGGAS